MVRLKKYFYVLRPLLAAEWVKTTGAVPPVEFQKLLTLLDGRAPVLAAVHELLEKKRSTPELGLAPAVPVLNEFIEAALAQELSGVPKKSGDPTVINLLNEIFHGVLREYEANNSLQPTDPKRAGR